MKTCAYCGRENEDAATRCRECGTAEFIVSAPPASPETPKAESTTEAPDPEPDVSPTGESVLCTSCLFSNIPDTPFCKRCGAPVGFISTIGPLEQIYAEGYAYRRAVEGRPKLIILVGMWLVFFPGLLWCLLLMFDLLGERLGLMGALFFLVFGGLAWMCGMMLYRVTKNFMRPQPERPGTADPSGVEK